MDRLTLNSQVGSDGVLNVSVPIGMNDANRPVQVTIEPKVQSTNGAGDYLTWLDGLAGRWQGELVRDDAGAFEKREPLS